MRVVISHSPGQSSLKELAPVRAGMGLLRVIKLTHPHCPISGRNSDGAAEVILVGISVVYAS